MSERETTGAVLPIHIEPNQLAQRARTLPSMSTVVQELSALVNDAKASSREFERVIRKDPGLAGRLLKLANSAAFGLSRRVSSIEHATVLLGVSRLLDVAMGASFSKLIPSTIPGYGITAREFWQHNVATAILAERIARELRLTLTSDAFTAGLLHDAGKLVIASFFPKPARDLAAARWAEDCPDLVAVERVLTGTDHAEAGGVVIESWNLPSILIDAARFHHRPEGASDPAHRDLVAVVALAADLAYQSGLSRVTDRRDTPPPTDVDGALASATGAPQRTCGLGLEVELLNDLVMRARPHIIEMTEITS